ncbi:MAG: hypothetical protein JWR25_1901 [Noviherbaspirillum sp.]|jgi:Flp pilus assembly pilin Flp|nr:hypothetical protein [Noviherbaspirillum sp.]MDB5795522.1 hypothetical protein [Noviherbaspirillum sp.]
MRVTSMRREQKGQGMTEYIIIVALIAVAAIAVYQFFGQTVRSQMAGIALEVSGQDAKGAIENARKAGEGAKGETGKKGLDKYNNEKARGE